MRISCPYCGDRSNDEFVILGCADALLERPRETSLAAFDRYLHERTNPAGLHRELWYHQGGCRQWLIVERNTVTHAVLSAKPARERGLADTKQHDGKPT